MIGVEIAALVLIWVYGGCAAFVWSPSRQPLAHGYDLI